MLRTAILCISSAAPLVFLSQRSKEARCEAPQTMFEATGNTPLLRIKSLSAATGCTILGKAEWLNPSGSVKDRAAKQIVIEAERSGKLKKGGTIIEASGGNTGVALAAMSASMGYKNFGAKVILAPLVGRDHEDHFEAQAKKLGRETDNAVHTDQFANLANYRAHFMGTGPELWRQSGGNVDAFVCAAGTGGTLAGVSTFLKNASDDRVKCYLMDPMGSSLFHWVNSGAFKKEGSSFIEGIGKDHLTENFKQSTLDGAVRGTDQEAIDMIYYLMRHEGICIGPSAALNLVGAVKVARKLGKGSIVSTVICDSGERYNTKVFNKKFLIANDILPSDSVTDLESDGSDISFIK
eukprot:GSChrysophyteH2.ASY1.ANO1.1548.1 assembled CDS